MPVKNLHSSIADVEKINSELEISLTNIRESVNDLDELAKEFYRPTWLEIWLKKKFYFGRGST